MKGRLFIVANRMPLTVETNDGVVTVRASSGGLVSAVSGYLETDGRTNYTDIFWAGIPDVNERLWQNHVRPDASTFTYLPVFVGKRLYDQYYNGFSNSVLWPLFHYFPSYAEYNEQHFKAYMEVNRMFADVLAQGLRKEDTVWIHDYHLLPLAGMLRERFPELTIGLFLHIPFPAYELFRIIPRKWQHQLLKGILGADLVGLHTQDYVQHLLHSLKTILKLDASDQQISYEGRQIKIDSFPIGVDYEKFQQAAVSSEVETLREQFRDIAGNRKVIFSVDRLDYTKGVSNRLKGFEFFLKEYPEFREQVVFYLVIVPSRDTILKYAERKKMIDEYVGYVNSKLGHIGWQPIVYQYGHLSFEELIALYTLCDLALITPIRDGMNLVAKEFVASRRDQKGVLILSEMAGAASELPEALLINPNDVGEIAEMIFRGLSMPESAQQLRMQQMQERVAQYNLNKWSSDFFREMDSVKRKQIRCAYTPLGTLERVELLNTYAKGHRRLFLLDYDGTLVPFTDNPEDALPGPELLATLAEISRHPANEVYIISGRTASDLDARFGTLPLNLIAEHGSLKRRMGEDWTLRNSKGMDWKSDILHTMNQYSARYPGSFIEEKDFSLAWHYRKLAADEGAEQAECLKRALLSQRHSSEFEVMCGNKIVEVRPEGSNKGTAALEILKQAEYDFILALGDDVTDEDMFRALNGIPGAFSIKIGQQASCAQYNLQGTSMALSLLETISRYAVLAPQ
jgi:trehalose 6-phosphate synthase/phosphatase